MAELKRGVLLKGRYRIDGVIGQGAMGAVYQARDEVLPGALWALKVLCEADVEPSEVAEAVGLFRREADISARLRHPGLPRVVDFFTEGACHVLVMERIHGETLDAIVDRQRRPMSEAELLPVLIQLASCLQYLHEQHPHPIVFRDLKPSNCMLTAGGKVTLIDFGIARYHKPGRKSDTIVIGTPGFCAPEQYGGAQTEPRSDLYSLGAMAWHLLSGEDPSAVGFTFPPLRTVAPGVSQATADIVARCVAFAPEGRYPSAVELLADLRWAASQVVPVAAPAAPMPSVAGRRTHRLQRAANQHLSRAAAAAAATPAATFGRVRPVVDDYGGRAIDRTFLAAWARRTFRVWWGAGSIYTSRILALLFMVMVLGVFAHLVLEASLDVDHAGASSASEYRRADTCLDRLETVRDLLDAWRVEHGRYPSAGEFGVLAGGLTCPESHRRYTYLPSTDRTHYVVRCNATHGPVSGRAELDSRTHKIVWTEAGR